MLRDFRNAPQSPIRHTEIGRHTVILRALLTHRPGITDGCPRLIRNRSTRWLRTRSDIRWELITAGELPIVNSEIWFRIHCPRKHHCGTHQERKVNRTQLKWNDGTRPNLGTYLRYQGLVINDLNSGSRDNLTLIRGRDTYRVQVAHILHSPSLRLLIPTPASLTHPCCSTSSAVQPNPEPYAAAPDSTSPDLLQCQSSEDSHATHLDPASSYKPCPQKALPTRAIPTAMA